MLRAYRTRQKCVYFCGSWKPPNMNAIRTEFFRRIRVNQGIADFELGKLTEEQLKCLVFVCGIKDACYVESKKIRR
uniref:Uncharacterized protein n=1 Tax=Anopheles stephensi TaxID=30069 RepID=A0A182YRB6_ANOST